MSRRLSLIVLALLAALAAIGAFPAAAADDNGVQVVEAGNALFPDRAYVLTLPEPRKPALTTDDVTVTEDGTPVKNLAVLSSASANGLGTVLLIDASNSMKGSIQAAMQAARAFAARNPGQPLSVVFFNATPKVALPLTTDPKQVQAALAKAPPLAEGTRLWDALAAAVAQVRGSSLGAARVVVLSDGDDVGSVTTEDAAISQLQAQGIRVFTVGIESSDFTAEGLQNLADKTGGTYAAATSPESLSKIYDQLGFELGNEYLLRYRSAARPDENVSVEVAVKGAQPVSFAYTSPSSGTSAPYQPSFRDDLLQSWLLVPLVVFLVLALIAFAGRSFWSLRNNKRLVQRLGDFVTLPAEEDAAQRRKEVDALLAAVGQDKQRRRNWRWMEGFSEDVDVAQIKRDPQKMVLVSVLAGLVVAVLARRSVLPVLGHSRSRSADRPEPVRARKGAQGAERLRRAAPGEPRRPRIRASRRPQPRRRDGRRRRRGAGAVEAGVQTRRHGRAARDPSRRGARGDRQADAEHRHRPGRRARACPARGRRKHSGGARSGDEEHSRTHGHPAARHGADRAGKVLGGGRCVRPARDIPLPDARQP